VASRKAPTSSRSWELPNITWETSIYYKKFSLVNEEQCREYCLSDCFCVAALFIGNSDCAEVAVLANGRRANDVTMKAFIKVRTGSAQSTRTRTVLRPNKIITICLPLIVVITIGGLLAQHYLGRNRESKQLLSTSVRAFSWQELYQATKGFEKTAAYWVKGASGRSTKVHHRNLVRMIGYCKEGKHRMLVFEFMPGGSLRSFLGLRGGRRHRPGARVPSRWLQRPHLPL
jgi:hypothetical protein